MSNYYSEILSEAGLKDSKENFALVDRAIEFVQDMEEITPAERRSELSRWINDETSAKRTMVVRRIKDQLAK